MGSARDLLRPLDPRRAGTIRRVVRVGRFHVCGLCRSRYAGEGDALGCVQDCWQEFQQFDPVIPRRQGLGVAYRCRFCARDHGTRKGAEHCAGECKERFSQRLAAEMAAAGQSDEPRPKRFRALAARPAPVVAVRRVAPVKKQAKKKLAGVPAADDPGIAPVNADVTPTNVDKTLDEAAAPATADAETAAAPAEAGKKKKVQRTAEGFTRDGARYVCEFCNEKYFTKSEVVACFAKHD